MNWLQNWFKLDHAALLHQQSVQELVQAARTVASHIVIIVMKADAVGVALPRGYQVIAANQRKFGMTRQSFMLVHNMLPPFHSKTEALKFANDIHTGFIAELTLFLQNGTHDNAEATVRLKNVAR